MQALLGAISVFSIYIYMYIVRRWNTAQQSYTKDIYNFKIYLGMPLKWLFIAAAFFALCAFGAFRASVENGHGLWIIFAVLSVAALLGGLYCQKTITVNGDDISIKEMLPPTQKHYSFAEITHYQGLNQGAKVYRGKKLLFSYDTDMLGAYNMTRRLQVEKIPHGTLKGYTVEVETVRKDWLWKRNDSLKGMLILFAIIFVICLAMFVVMSDLITATLMTLVIVGVFVLLFIYMAVALIIPALKTIHEIERKLGIDFDAEMKRLGVTNFDYVDDNWYMTQIKSFVSVVHRSEVGEILKVSEDRTKACYVYVLRTNDQKKRKVYTYSPEKFEEWLNRVV